MPDIVGFEHIHLHTHHGSLLDGYGDSTEYTQRAMRIGQKYLCITDHGMMSAVPSQIRACDASGIIPIFGCELYLNPNQMEVTGEQVTGDIIKEWPEEQRKAMRKSYHLLAIARNNEGYKNLVYLSSWGWLKGFYYKPRINHEVLMAHKEGIIFGSACYNGEVGQAFEHGGEVAAMAMIEKYLAMFGEDIFFEIMLLDFHKQKAYNAFLVKARKELGINLLLTNDAHYANPEDSKMQQIMLMIQTKKTLAEIEEEKKKAELSGDLADLFELQDTNLWMKSEEELNQKWEQDYKDIIPEDVLNEAKRNSVSICERAKGVTLDRSLKLPQFEKANERLKQSIMDGFLKRRLPKTREYLDRIKEEYSLICEKDFASYFLIDKMFTDEARRWWAEQTGGDGTEAVGPGRGSAAGSLSAYCMGITDVDPIRHELLFSRFLSPARGGKTIQLKFKKVKPVKRT